LKTRFEPPGFCGSSAAHDVVPFTGDEGRIGLSGQRRCRAGGGFSVALYFRRRGGPRRSLATGVTVLFLARALRLFFIRMQRT